MQLEEIEHTHKFETCPDCGGALSYPTQSDAQCADCEGQYSHEIRASGRRHLLWRFTHDDGMTEIVARANYHPSRSVSGSESE